MHKQLTRDEDTALRCLAALVEAGHQLTPEQAALLSGLLKRDRRATIRREGTKVPRQKQDDAA